MSRNPPSEPRPSGSGIAQLANARGSDKPGAPAITGDAYRAFLDLLRRLDAAKIYYRLHHSREDALMIEAVVPGQRWEVELVDYGDEFHWAIERFVSNGHIDHESALDELFAKFSDEEPAVSHDTPPRQ